MAVSIFHQPVTDTLPPVLFCSGDRIQIGDNVGLLQMADKTYLAFDELLLYIEITQSELRRYGIELVSGIE